MEVERYLLASALTGIISQKLARKLCPHCRKLRPTNDYEKNIIKRVTGKNINEIYTAVGCDVCKNGYSGRIAIHEVLIIEQAIKDAISSNIRKDKLRRLVYNENVISLLQDGISKVLEGLTTLEELLKIIELDDDSNVSATGLENAIQANELIKEDLISHNANIVQENIEKTESNDANENLFVEPENLIKPTIESQNPIQNISQNENASLNNNDTQSTLENPNQKNSFEKITNFNDKKTLFSSNRADLF